MAPSRQSTTITHTHPTWKEQLSLSRGTTFARRILIAGKKLNKNKGAAHPSPQTLFKSGHGVRLLKRSHVVCDHRVRDDVVALGFDDQHAALKRRTRP